MPEEKQPERIPSLIQEKLLLRIGLGVFLIDQATKLLVVRHFKVPDPTDGGIVIIQGVLNFTYRLNTGAAWSILSGNNTILAIVALLAIGGLLHFRRHFDSNRTSGKISLGLLVGGVLGNFIDRIFHKGVVDFVDFYFKRENGTFWHYPAFNVADAAICTGVALLFIMAWRGDDEGDESEQRAG